jgi:hypothetical protein
VPGEAVAAPSLAGGEGAVSLLRGTPTGLTADRDLLVSQDSPGAEDVSEAGDFFGSPLAFGDSDGDGRSDLVVGIPREDIGDIGDAGAVQVIPGSAAGFDLARDTFISQASPNIAGDPEDRSQLAFGAALATGSFDADPFEDLAVGSPGEDEPTRGFPSGAVHVLYGSANGIRTARAQRFTGEVPPGITSYTGARFGFALAGADFDADGIDDLAVGAPREETGREVPNASVISGAVFVFSGTPAGVTAAGRRVFHQNSPGVTDVTENGDEFGHALGAGAFDGDAAADLAIGVPDERIGSVFNTGAVNVLRGAPGTGLSGSGGRFLHQSTPGVLDTSEVADQFGSTLTGSD